MLSIGPATRVFLVLGATDMRKGYDGLYGMVWGYLKEDPLSGHLFVREGVNAGHLTGGLNSGAVRKNDASIKAYAEALIERLENMSSVKR